MSPLATEGRVPSATSQRGATAPLRVAKGRRESLAIKKKDFPDREKLLLAWQGSSMLRNKVLGVMHLLGAAASALRARRGRVGADCFARLNTAHIVF